MPVSTLDTVLGARFDNESTLIIVDIEGAELGMLQGATLLLNSNIRPTWFVEISVSEHQPQGIEINPNLLTTFELFSDLGYAAITADNKPRLIGIEEIRTIMAKKIDTLQTHNFIFIESAKIDQILSLI